MRSSVVALIFASTVFAATTGQADSIRIPGTAIERLRGAEWELVIFQADDQVDLFINSKKIEQCTLDCIYDLTPTLKTGENSLRIVLSNRTSTWTYGYALFHRGEPYAIRMCGIRRSIGCKNDDTSIGEVFSETIPIFMKP